MNTKDSILSDHELAEHIPELGKVIFVTNSNSYSRWMAEYVCWEICCVERHYTLLFCVGASNGESNCHLRNTLPN